MKLNRINQILSGEIKELKRSYIKEYFYFLYKATKHLKRTVTQILSIINPNGMWARNNMTNASKVPNTGSDTLLPLDLSSTMI